jgi:nucleoside-diphosphate-sugar epimerase
MTSLDSTKLRSACQSKYWRNADPLIKEFYRSRKVLVIGADGFLGTNCIEALKALDAEISIVTRRPQPRVVDFSGSVFRGDVRDPKLVHAAVDGQDIVVDFLGVAGAVDSNRDPNSNLEDELRAHLSIFHACAVSRPSPVVLFCSSRLVFGAPKYLPVDENHPLAPGSIYAVHKITAEKYLELFAETQGLRSCVFRLSNPYGPNQAEEQRGYGIINQFLRNAARGKPIKLYGDGRQKRDYVHVEDVLGAFLPCAMDQKCHGQIFNFGGHTTISLRDAAELIAQLAGGIRVTFEPWPTDYRTVETGDYATDFRKIDSYLSLPAQRPLEEGFLEVLNSYRIGRRKSAFGASAAAAGSRVMTEGFNR